MVDGKGAIYFWRDVDKTCESIATVSPEDVEFAASGHNAARVVLKDVKGSWF